MVSFQRISKKEGRRRRRKRRRSSSTGRGVLRDGPPSEKAFLAERERF
jgi:hypothetical protein